MPYSTADVYIVNGNITFFLGSHSEAFKKDIVYSSLLGHLASTSHSIASDAWLSSYTRTLNTLFWITQSTGSQRLKKQSVSILKLTMPTLSSYLSTQEIKQLTEALCTVKNLPEDSEIRTVLLNRIQLDHNSPPASTTVCPLLTVVSGNKTILSLRPVFDTSHSVDMGILDQELPQEDIIGEPRLTHWVTYLAEDKYVSVRSKIIEKLGSKINTHVHHLGTSNVMNLEDA